MSRNTHATRHLTLRPYHRHHSHTDIVTSNTSVTPETQALVGEPEPLVRLFREPHSDGDNETEALGPRGLLTGRPFVLEPAASEDDAPLPPSLMLLLLSDEEAGK